MKGSMKVFVVSVNAPRGASVLETRYFDSHIRAVRNGRIKAIGMKCAFFDLTGTQERPRLDEHYVTVYTTEMPEWQYRRAVDAQYQAMQKIRGALDECVRAGR